MSYLLITDDAGSQKFYGNCMDYKYNLKKYHLKALDANLINKMLFLSKKVFNNSRWNWGKHIAL